MPARRRPTAAFCGNDLVAAAAVPLTSVRQPRSVLGTTAAEMLLSEASDPEHRHEQQVFLPELVARRSTIGT